MAILASYRVPYWRAFSLVVPLFLIGVIAAAIWAVNWGSVVLLAIAIIGLERFTFRTMYEVNLGAGGLHGRALIKSWNIPLEQIADVIPGWRRSFWRSNPNVYVITRTSGPQLFIWCAKGLHEFLTAIGSLEPRLEPREEDGQSRAERSRGPSGFVSHLADRPD